ncbi:AMP-binding protein [Magnetospirillum sp. 15-1]|uniref:AMP-binding protein n=1 Tax=Magnetospirillum sp. 15-1 TaxID=1979370 RepID=UPI001481D681|nr:AMP-binding protein [Magnetospirillum sp. 15-1]
MIRLEHLSPAAFAPDHVVAFRRGETLRWQRFCAEIGGTARQLAGCRRVAVIGDDSWDFAVGLLGALSAGAAVILPVNTQPATLAALAGQVERVVDASFVPGAAEWKPALSAEGSRLIFHTSGSTGAAKRVERGLGNLSAELEALHALWGEYLAGAVALATVPHHHVYGLVFKLLWPLAAGRPFLAGRHDLWETLLAEMPEGALLVTSPAHLTRLGGLEPLLPGRRPRMVLSAGAPLPEAAAGDAACVLGVPVTEIYGSTETGAMATRRRDGAGEPSWHPLPGYGIAPTAEGLLRLDAPVGRLDIADHMETMADGGFRLMGRADRVAKVEGKRISLDEVERALEALPQVERAAVLVLDGRLAAVLVLGGEGREALGALGRFRFGRRLRRQLAAGLEPICLPRRWRFVEALPMGDMGKCRAADLAELFAAPDRLPAVLGRRETGEGAVALDLKIGTGLPWFQGHFPGHPILPGVVQLDWAAHFARTELGLSLPAAQEFQIKFKAVIRPGHHVALALRHDAAKGRLAFEYRRGDDVCSSGTVYL